MGENAMTQNGLMSEIHEVGVVGGGPAGLQAALTLGRMHVATVLFDDARYRNATAAQMHNVLGWDGAAPAALRSAGHAELAAYPWVSVVATQVTTARADPAGLLLRAADSEWLVQRLLIATGVANAPLPIAGLAELWGDVVLPCPYCHGHEFSPGPIAVISSGSHAEHVGNLLRKLATAVPVFAPEAVAAVTRTASGVVIGLRDGAAVEAACVFVAPNPTPRVQIAAALGVATGPDGIEVDSLGRTSRPGVWAAGDVTKRADPRIPAAVLTAMASGLTAAADIAATLTASVDTRTS